MSSNFSDARSALTDPSDWSVGALRELDRLLRCPICFEYFKTPVILPCSHSYCSLCVRRYICVKNTCPSCHKPANDSQLLRNVGIEDVVSSYCKNRAVLMQLCKSFSSSSSSTSMTTTATATATTTITPTTKSHTPTNTQSSKDIEHKQMAVHQIAGKDVLGLHTQRKQLHLGEGIEKEEEKEADEENKLMREKEVSSEGGDKDVKSNIIPTPPPELFLEDEDSRLSPSLLSPHSSTSQDTCSDIPLAQACCTNLESPTSGSQSPPTPLITPIRLDRIINEGSKGGGRGRQTVRIRKRKLSEVGEGQDQSYSGDAQLQTSTSNAHVDVPRGVCELAKKCVKLMTVEHKFMMSHGTWASSRIRIECPVCGLHVKESYVNVHLDMCLQRTPARSTGRPAHHLPRLPKLCFNIMKDRELKRRLKEYHLTPSGGRQAMISKLKEFTLQYNAQCDSSSPKTIAQIAAEVEEIERVQNRPLKRSSVSLQLNRSSTEEDIVREHQKYVEAHKDQFSKLIKEVQTKPKKSMPMPVVKEEPVDFDFEVAGAAEPEKKEKTEVSIKVERDGFSPHPASLTTQATPSRISSLRKREKRTRVRKEIEEDEGHSSSDPEYIPSCSSKHKTRRIL